MEKLHYSTAAPSVTSPQQATTVVTTQFSSIARWPRPKGINSDDRRGEHHRDNDDDDDDADDADDDAAADDCHHHHDDNNHNDDKTGER